MRSTKWSKRIATTALAALVAGCASPESPSGTDVASCDVAAWDAYLAAKPKRRVDFPVGVCGLQVPEATSVVQRYDVKGSLVYQAFRYDAAALQASPTAYALAVQIASQHLGSPSFIDCKVVVVDGRVMLEKAVDKNGVTAEVLVKPTDPDGSTFGSDGEVPGSPVYAWAPVRFTERLLPPTTNVAATTPPDFAIATKAANDAMAALGQPVGDLGGSLVQRVFLPASPTSVPALSPATTSFAVPAGFARKELHCTLLTGMGALYRVVAAPLANGAWGAREAYRITTIGDVRYEHQVIL